MKERFGTSFLLSKLLAIVMIVQAVSGLLLPGEYRDVEWIRATWFGNDWVTLVIGVPLLMISLMSARRDSTRGTLLWLGMLGYAIYNYAFYLLGAALNVFFPLYITPLLFSSIALILALSRIDPVDIAAGFGERRLVRIIGGYLLFVAIGLATVWMVIWAAHVFGGRPTPVDTEAFKLVAALDMTLMVPALATGGILLWRHRPWGYVIASIAGVQGSLYLLVLAVNSFIAVQRGLAEAPGEIPMWGTLAVTTAIATFLLLKR